MSDRTLGSLHQKIASAWRNYNIATRNIRIYSKDNSPQADDWQLVADVYVELVRRYQAQVAEYRLALMEHLVGDETVRREE